MHELGIARSIVSIVAENAGGRPVTRVVLEIGTLAGVMKDAVAFCFDAVTKGTVLEGARLDIREIEAVARCRACGATFAQQTLFDACDCGSHSFERVSGEELNIKEFEFASPSDAAYEPEPPQARRA